MKEQSSSVPDRNVQAPGVDAPEVESHVKPVHLSIDIVSDVVCPWCVIGYKQLERALADLEGWFITRIQWRPFELNPDMPAAGQNLREHIAAKYGSSDEQSAAARSRLTRLGNDLGFRFDYHDGMRMVNTFRAHQLLHWAAFEGRQTELQMALFAAFFSSRQDVSDIDVLVQCAAEVGLDPTAARNALASASHAEAVRQEQSLWHERDVYAVPTFFFQDSYCLPGAQEAEVFVRLLRKIHARESPGRSAAE